MVSYKNNVEKKIDKLKSRLKVRFDKELVKHLGVNQYDIGNWRKRNKIPNRYQDKFNSLMRVDNNNKEEQGSMEFMMKHLNELNDLKSEKIKNLEEHINQLKIENKRLSQSKKVKPVFHFKTKADYDPITQLWGGGYVRGDTTMLGYTEEELMDLDPEGWKNLYHPKSQKELDHFNISKPIDYQHTKAEHLMIKAKDGSYKIFNLETYFIAKEKCVRAFFYWVNGDLEGKS